ncbi:hypothetical protein [Bifidobacterium thermophilum]|uniref:Uncharacterized protein n=1 Tax=Bifidobacterium thermophilum TaxID=33905 RepID=A0A7X9NQ95_9BIFI|nr:hypothetical protein [Bifidobacterium thermophilum]NME61840.1 hypothetical protein [Bifidobacterium thermophilum]
MRRLIGVVSPPYPSMDVYEDDGVESVCVDIIPDPANLAEAGYRLGREIPCGLGSRAWALTRTHTKNHA